MEIYKNQFRQKRDSYEACSLTWNTRSITVAFLPFKKFMKVELLKLAHARSGDKGDTANVGVIALRDEFYPLIVREVTAEKVKQHFGAMVKGEVERFELPNLNALNFLLHESLGGGGTLSLMTDAQGKTFSTALLRMKIEITETEAKDLGAL